MSGITQELTDFKKKEKIIVGILPGDGVGPILMEQALRVLNELAGACFVVKWQEKMRDFKRRSKDEGFGLGNFI